MIGLLNSMTEVTCAMTAGNKATLEAIERAMGPGASTPPPEVVKLLKTLKET